VTGFENEAGGVTVRTDKGDIHGAALVAADGGRSVIREEIVGDPLPPATGHMCYRAVLNIDEVPKDLRLPAATLWAGHNTHIVHYPLRGWKLFNLVATVIGKHTSGGHNELATPEEALPFFSHYCDKIMSLMRTPKEFRRWMLLYRQPVDNWTQGRVTLLGDAAHLMLQYMAQGAAMAMEDAVALGVCADLPGKTSSGPICATDGTPQSRIARSSSLDRISSAFRAPGSPPAITPKSVARPVSTACAPSARALRMSTPRRTPPSASTVILFSSTREIAGKASSVAAAPSSCRPPWFDTTTPSQPAAAARSASSGRSTPLSSSFPGH
jgi:hypothetical protein